MSQKNNIFEINELLLLSGNDIPFPSAQIEIHPPSIREIAYIGEENFFMGCELLNFSKNSLTEMDKNRLENYSNFDIIMSIIQDKNNNKALQKNLIGAKMVLLLLFPNYTIEFTQNKIILNKDNSKYYIDNNNFEEFKLILQKLLCMVSNNSIEYKPEGELAKKIADTLKKGAQKRAQLSGDKHTKFAILSRYVSILAVGEQKNLNDLMNYTIYQLFDEFKRYELKINYDICVKAKLAGAQDVKMADSWMKDIHEEK